MDEFEFRHKAEDSIEALKEALLVASDDADFEVEEAGEALHIHIDEPPGHFVVSPNATARQLCITGKTSSFKLGWSGTARDFVLEKTGERLKPLIMRLMNQHYGEKAVTLK